MNKKTTCGLMAVLVVFVGALGSQGASSSARKKKDKHKKAATVTTEDDSASQPAVSAGSMKSSLEAYLRRRQAKLERAQKARGDFITKEGEIWTNFWNKIFDNRNRFEVSVARQRLDTIESLSSLDPNDRAASIVDFEKLQITQMRSFEEKQRQKIQNFFAQHETRWKEFAFQQEKERAESADEAESAWQNQKAALLGESGSLGIRERAPAPRPADAGQDEPAPSSDFSSPDWSVR